MQSEESWCGASPLTSPRFIDATLAKVDTHPNLIDKRCLIFVGPKIITPQLNSCQRLANLEIKDFVRSYVCMSFCYAFPTWFELGLAYPYLSDLIPGLDNWYCGNCYNCDLKKLFYKKYF